jgi:hypothetical protein
LSVAMSWYSLLAAANAGPRRTKQRRSMALAGAGPG